MSAERAEEQIAAANNLKKIVIRHCRLLNVELLEQFPIGFAPGLCRDVPEYGLQERHVPAAELRHEDLQPIPPRVFELPFGKIIEHFE